MGLLDWLAGPSRGSTGLAQGLTASAARVEGDSTRRQGYRRLIQPWQATALGYYDSLGECWYPAQFYGRALARIRLYPAVVKPDGEIEKTENPKAQKILARVQDPGGGRSNMLRTYGQLRFVTGESYLLVTEDDGDEAWEMVSVDELRINATQNGSKQAYTRYRAPQLQPEFYGDVPDDAYEPVPDSAIVYRFWQRHPRYSALSDSPTKAVLTLYDLLARLTAAEISNAKSRAANAGILFLANEILWGDVGVQDEDPAQDPFLRDLTTAMVAAIKDPGEASASVPMIARIPAEMIESQRGFHHLKLRDPNEMSEAELIEKTVRRIATGLDIPPEVLLGLEDTNHWNAWMIQDETWQSHLGPAAQAFCDDLTTAYFRPACRDQKIDGWETMVVAYDATEVINHPDRGADADAAFDRGAIGYDAYRDAKGFQDSDAPTDDELVTMVAVKANNVDALKTDEATGTEETDVATQDSEQDGAGANAANEVKPGPPEEPVPSDMVAASIVAMADVALERCRELAGSRLRTHARGCDTCAERLDGVPQELVASVLGFETATELDAPSPSALVAGGTKAFVRSLERRGIGDAWALRLAELVELHAARTLFQADAPPLPAGFAEAARRAT